MLPCNASNLPPPISTNDIFCQMHDCWHSTTGASNIIVFSGVNVLLLLPLLLYVLCLGWKRWGRRGATATMGHSDLFAYHMAVMDMLSVLGSILVCCGVHATAPQMEMHGFHIYTVIVPGQMFFHTLTCVERYIAVVHPITYLELKKTNGIRLRNVAIGCVWLLSCIFLKVVYLKSTTYAVLVLSVTGLILAVVSFCCFSVLCVLNRPGPANGTGGRTHIDQSKLRALHTIEAIVGMLLLRFAANIVAAALYPTKLLGKAETCTLWFAVFWLCVPSGLVLPLLSLHREAKLRFCRRKAELGEGSD